MKITSNYFTRNLIIKVYKIYLRNLLINAQSDMKYFIELQLLFINHSS